jgi:hypothetical protein
MVLKKLDRLYKIQPATVGSQFSRITADLVRSNIKKYAPKADAKILVIGCTQRELEELKEDGFTNVTGINLEGDAPILKMDMNDIQLPKASFDLVMAEAVIEHSYLPYITLLELRKVLKDGGLLAGTLQLYTPPNFHLEHPFLVTIPFAKEILPRLFCFEVLEFKELPDGVVFVWRKNDSMPIQDAWPGIAKEAYNFVKDWD